MLSCRILQYLLPVIPVEPFGGCDPDESLILNDFANKPAGEYRLLSKKPVLQGILLALAPYGQKQKKHKTSQFRRLPCRILFSINQAMLGSTNKDMPIRKRLQETGGFI